MTIKQEENITVKVGRQEIGPNQPIFIIAEIGLNHNQDYDLALRLIDAAVEAGCSAVKFQTFRARDVYIKDGAGTYELMGKKIPIYDLHASLEMPADWVFKLKEYSDSCGVEFFSAPIGKVATKLLLDAGVPAMKVASYECSNLPFLEYLAEQGLPIIMSSGAATLAELDAATRLIKSKNVPLALMHCLTKYPAPLNIANLAIMETLRRAFRVPVGFSNNGFVKGDGLIDDGVISDAVAKLGGDLFEIHITLNRAMPGPDHGFATEPDELKKMVSRMQIIRRQYNSGERFEVAPQLIGSSEKIILPEEQYVRNFAYKCIFATKDIKKGERLSEENVAVLRPGESARGLEPAFYNVLLGARATHDISACQPITWGEVLSL